MSIKRQLMHVQYIRDPKKKTSYVYFIEKQKLPNGDIKKVVITEKDPTYRFYINEQFVPETANAVNFIEKEKVKAIDVPYSKLYSEVLNLVIDNEDLKNELLGADYSAKQSAAINSNNCHLIDLNIVDYKIREYLERYNKELDVIPLKKVFLDIETDISDYDDFPHPEIAPCPINMFSYLDNEEMILYCGILYDETNDSQLEFLEEALNDEDNLLERIRLEEFPDVKELKLEIFFNEVDLIKFVFDKIKHDKPDFVGG